MTETSDHHPLGYAIRDDLGNVSPDPDSETTDEYEDHLHHKRQEALLRGILQDIDERKKYAAQIYWLTVGWLALMGYILLVQGYNAYWFELHDSVLIALVTTTTTGIVGLLVLVTKYLFPTKE